jgi:hypothetical protein
MTSSSGLALAHLSRVSTAVSLSPTRTFTSYLTYLRFGRIATTDNIRKVVTSRTIKPAEQRILTLPANDVPAASERRFRRLRLWPEVK